MKKIYLLATIAASATMFSGCATIMSGTKQDISITSYPEGAKVKINGADVCGATPCKVSLDRKKENAVITVEKDGYQPTTRALTSDMNSWLIGNVLGLGVFGSTTDAMNGSMYKYESGAVHFELKQK